MIDTVILLLGFVCAALVYFLCAAEYGLVAQQNHIGLSLRKYMPKPAHMHAVIFAIVCLCAVASSLVSNQLGGPNTETMTQPSAALTPSSALVVPD